MFSVGCDRTVSLAVWNLNSLVLAVMTWSMPCLSCLKWSRINAACFIWDSLVHFMECKQRLYFLTELHCPKVWNVWDLEGSMTEGHWITISHFFCCYQFRFSFHLVFNSRGFVFSLVIVFIFLLWQMMLWITLLQPQNWWTEWGHQTNFSSSVFPFFSPTYHFYCCCWVCKAKSNCFVLFQDVWFPNYCHIYKERLEF